MLILRSLRGGLSLLLLAALVAVVALSLNGCSDDTTSPTSTQQATAPVLPDPETLTFDFSFFDDGADLDKATGEHDNFINAYLRVAVIGAVTRLVLTPPVTAFAIALHTRPMLQSDGSWIWTYEWRDGDNRALISLQGLPRFDEVDWTMRVTLQDGGHDVDDAVWFTGTTCNDGEEGRWFFYDFEQPAGPLCAEIAWGEDERGDFLEFTSREPDSDGDTLRYTDADPDYYIDYAEATAADTWFIHWNDDGHGSLRVPDYNGGEEACWDVYQHDTECR
jgi:hypothetical protein